MATVREILEPARRRLAAAGIERPGREAALLLRTLLGMSEAALLAHDRDPVPPSLAERFVRRIEARARRVPAAYLLGEREFYGRAFLVDPRVLIPRPESEGLIDAALDLPLPDTARALDLATGSGCLAVTLAAEKPAWSLVATDLSPAALAVAGRNASRHGVGGRVARVAADLTLGLGTASFDLVVVNPPYVDPAARAALTADVRDHEPSLALFAGRRGLALYERLFAGLAELAPGGFLICEIGDGQARDVAALASATGRWQLRERRLDAAGIERHLVWRRSV